MNFNAFEFKTGLAVYFWLDSTRPEGRELDLKWNYIPGHNECDGDVSVKAFGDEWGWVDGCFDKHDLIRIEVGSIGPTNVIFSEWPSSTAAAAMDSTHSTNSSLPSVKQSSSRLYWSQNFEMFVVVSVYTHQSISKCVCSGVTDTWPQVYMWAFEDFTLHLVSILVWQKHIGWREIKYCTSSETYPKY